MSIFGPVPSRRLGRSLGVNNIPFKTCSYSCTYCQLGRTNKLSIKRTNFVSPQTIFEEVKARFNLLKERNEKIDYITIVPDGEPTLDINLGKTIKLLKTIGTKIAVISNASLIWDDGLKEDLQHADWISFKIDSANEKIWKKINRPHGSLRHEAITKGMLEFASTFKGKLVTETMLLNNVNDGFPSLMNTVGFIQKLNADKSYILIPTRPPAEKNVIPPSIERLIAIYKLYTSTVGETELIMNNEGVEFSFINDLEKELLGITSVHPMRADAINEFLGKSNGTWKLVDNLVDKNLLKAIEYGGNKYFIRNFIN